MPISMPPLWGCSRDTDIAGCPAGVQTFGQAGIPRRKVADCRPVERVVALGQQCQQPVAQQARQRHRHTQVVGGREGQLNVLVAEGAANPAGLNVPRSNESAIGLVNGDVEQGRCRSSRYCRRSRPPLPTSAMASPSASIAEAIRKLPLSFTRLATRGVSETTNVFWPIVSKSGVAASTARKAVRQRR